jgi:hypothetical protein
MWEISLRVGILGMSPLIRVAQMHTRIKAEEFPDAAGRTNVGSLNRQLTDE